MYKACRTEEWPKGGASSQESANWSGKLQC